MVEKGPKRKIPKPRPDLKPEVRGEIPGVVINGVYMSPKPTSEQQRGIQEKVDRIRRGQY